MDNLWTQLNNAAPQYLAATISQFSLQVAKLGDLETALIKENHYALIISIDRFAADVDYVMCGSDGQLVRYQCGNFLAEKFGNDDRQGLISGDTAKELVINNLIVINNGLNSKWNDLLNGDSSWIEAYKRSKWFSDRKLRQDEIDILGEYLSCK